MTINRSDIIAIAARLVRSDRLLELRQLCETQKSISTQRLLLYVEELESSDCRLANWLKKLADTISHEPQSESE